MLDAAPDRRLGSPTMTTGTSDQLGVPLRERLRAALKPAMKARDLSAVSALRSALSAIDNAEAIDAGDGKAGALENSALGLGAAEAARRDLSETEIVQIVRHEIDERRTAAKEYDRLGAAERRDQLTSEADVLTALL
ncbi:GatB/YqeY domain-containing protein [Nocardia mangyaensis]|nr:GatB/YqeY domain-containing protein [Nocardia mangyaensis]